MLIRRFSATPIALALVGTVICAADAWAGTGCAWTMDEKQADAFAELDAQKGQGGIVFRFKDGLTCEPVIGASVELAGQTFQTNAAGLFEVPLALFGGQKHGSVNLRATHAKYFELREDVEIMLGQPWKMHYVLSPLIPANQARFVLQWQNRPADLDLHLTDDDGMHVSYRKKRSFKDRAKLDVDDTDGSGPETITLYKIKPGRTYRIAVESYSGEAFEGKERLAVYINGGLREVIAVPAGASREIQLLEFSTEAYKSIQLEGATKAAP